MYLLIVVAGRKNLEILNIEGIVRYIIISQILVSKR